MRYSLGVHLLQGGSRGPTVTVRPSVIQSSRRLVFTARPGREFNVLLSLVIASPWNSRRNDREKGRRCPTTPVPPLYASAPSPLTRHWEPRAFEGSSSPSRTSSASSVRWPVSA